MNQDDKKQQLISELLNCVKQCQIRFGGRTELGTDLDSRVVRLCASLEEIFSHGLKKNRTLINITKKMISKSLPKSFANGKNDTYQADLTFWHFVRLFLNKHEYERYMCLKNIHTDIGRARAWLRSTLNENSLERYICMFLGDGLTFRSQFYEDWSLLLDEERNSLFSSAVRGLSSILFAINIDNSELNHQITNKCNEIESRSEPLPVVLNHPGDFESRRKRRLPRINIVSLGNDSKEDDKCSTHSAPPTCLSSPELSNINNMLPPETSGCFSSSDWMANETHSDVEDNEPILESNNLLLTPIGDDRLSFIETLVPNDEVEFQNEVFKASSLGLTCSEENSSNESLLNNLIRDNSPLRNSLEQIKTVHETKISKLESQLAFLNKENDNLKIQLRKYISAIQMLQPESQEILESFTDSGLDLGRISPTSFQFYKEALEYEKKLIQVAEMHGELVEFNDRLHKTIAHKDAIIKRLKNELIELRGPLPNDDSQSDEEDFSLISEYIETSQQTVASSSNRPLISIWIPTAFLTSQQNSAYSHHLYQIYVRVKDEEWNVYRRYSQFYALHKSLKKQFPNAKVLSKDFPPKKTIGNKDAKVVQERRKKLESYLRGVVNMLQVEHNISDKNSLILILPFLEEKRMHKRRDSKSRSDTQLNTGTVSQSPSVHCYTGY